MARTAPCIINCSMRIGDRIKAAREATGLSQEALAKAVGRSQSAVAEWETNESAPRRDIIGNLADTLKVTQEWLEFGQAAAQEELSISAGTLTERQLREAMGPILSVLGVRPGNWPVVARALLKAIQAAQSLDPARSADRFAIAGEYAAQEVRREILPTKAK